MSGASKVRTLGIFIYAWLHRNAELICAKKKQNESVIGAAGGCAKNE